MLNHSVLVYSALTDYKTAMSPPSFESIMLWNSGV